jgi:glutamyl/glutaminyl-tRNA synthetase
MASILNKNGKKLSKREGSVSVQDFREQGYPAEAVVNFIALLGWNPKTEQEIFTLPELIEQFDIAKMGKSGGVFDLDRLNWISNQHIKKMTIDDLYERGIEFLKTQDFYQTFLAETTFSADEIKKYIQKVLTVEQDRLSKFTEIGRENLFFFKNADELNYLSDDIRWKDNSDEETKDVLERAVRVLEKISIEDWILENLEKILMAEAGEKRGDFLFPLRGVLTGEKRSPSPFECAWVLGKEESLKRVELGIKKLK